MKIHQLLFGYDNGHGLLAGSKSIESARDIARLSMLTDWTSYQGASDDSSYISAFPLTESNQYAITKSWYAYEMSRPGCVWTHVLLIDIATVDPSFDFKDLYSLFRRPIPGKYADYSVALEYEQVLKKSQPFQLSSYTDEISVIFIFDTLLKGTPFGIKIERNAFENQMFILSIMQYLPIDVLKTLSFSSGSEKFRIIDKDTMFTMQFVQNGNTVSLQTPPWKDDVSDQMFNPGLRFLATSCFSNNNDIAKLLRSFRNDILGSYPKVDAFCTLLSYLKMAINQAYSIDYLNILHILSTNFPSINEGTLIKTNFLSKNVSSLFCKEKDFLLDISILENLNAFDFHILGIEDRLRFFREENIEEYINLLIELVERDSINEFGNNILKNCFETMPSNFIKEVATRNWHAFVSLLYVNEVYLYKAEWIDLDSVRFRDVLSCFVSMNLENFEYWDKLLDKVLNDNTPLTDNSVNLFVNNCSNYNFKILDFLNSQSDTTKALDSNVINSVARNESILLKWFSSQMYCSHFIAQLLITIVSPTGAEIRKYESSILLPLSKYDNGIRSIQYYVFLFQASYNWHDLNAQNYLKQSFYPLHKELAKGNDCLWSHLENHGASVSFWHDWDKCKKLRKGVARYIKSVGYSRAFLEKFTPDKQINDKMLSYWE